MRRMGIGLGVGINRSNYAQGIFNAYQSRVVADGGVTEAGGCVDAVGGLLLNASLLLIPSGYKSTKLYSEIPTNGNGDLTWARTSTANRTNSSGNLELMATGVPRLSYMYGSCPSVLLEPQRTNLLTYSNTPTDSSWSKTSLGAGTAPVVTANAATSPDGTTNASRVQFNCGGTTSSDRSILRQNITIANTTNYAGTFYVKAYSSGEIGKQLRFVIEGVTSQVIITLTDSWQRVATTGASSTTSTNYLIETRGGTTTNTTADVLIYGAQFEAGAYPTTYIPTTSATATRIADSFSRNNIYTNGLISASGGTWFVELRGNVAYTRDATSNYLYIGDSITSGVTSGVRSFGFRNNQTTSVRLAINFFNGSTSTTLYTTTADRVKIALKFNGTTMDIFENGTKVVSGASVSITLANFEFLCGNAQVPYFIQQMALYPSPLSDTDCTTLTTL